jgi:hypothetical protein
VCGEGAADCDRALGLLDLLGGTRRVEHMLCRAMPHGLGAVVRADEVKQLEFLQAWRRATGSRVPFRALWRPRAGCGVVRRQTKRLRRHRRRPSTTCRRQVIDK